MHQQQSAESLITRSVSASAYSSRAVSAAAPRITCLHRCQAPEEEGTGTLLSPHVQLAPPGQERQTQNSSFVPWTHSRLDGQTETFLRPAGSW